MAGAMTAPPFLLEALMGTIRIELQGSFADLPKENEDEVTRQASFGASSFGHARAVAATIEWLSRYILPKAIALDAMLVCEGELPQHGIGINGCMPTPTGTEDGSALIVEPGDGKLPS